jgi:hypothetical protein
MRNVALVPRGAFELCEKGWLFVGRESEGAAAGALVPQRTSLSAGILSGENPPLALSRAHRDASSRHGGCIAADMEFERVLVAATCFPERVVSLGDTVGRGGAEAARAI